MSLHQRSTNERALARHRFKHSRHPVEIRAVDEEAATSALDVASLPPSNPVVITPAFPPIGTTVIPTQLNPLPTASSHPVHGANTVLPHTISISSSSLSLSSTPSSVLPSSSPSMLVQVTSSPSSTPISSPSIPSATPAQTDAVKSGSSPKSQSLSPGAVGGIVTVIVVLALVIFGFFARRRAQHRRAMKRNTWGAGLVPALESKRADVYPGQPFARQSMPPRGDVPAPEYLEHIPRTLAMSQTLPASSIPGLTAPASSYDPVSPVSPLFPSSIRGAPSLRSVVPSTPSSSPAAAELATVVRTFITSLPDELHIANGEQICILTAYEDGWAFCSNSHGAQGFVPLECLQRSTSVPAEMQLQPQSQLGGSELNRTSKRLSSLTPQTAGTY